jgi:hypothetical protein
MGFASSYLEQRALFPELVKEAPDENTGIIVVIPAYNEPGIPMLLDCLASCNVPDCITEVLIIINAPANASAESIENNKATIENIEGWKNKNINCFFRLFVLVAKPTMSGWGVGLARKTGMDEALRRFNRIENPHGVILSLDADCQVEKNYFLAVYDELFINNGRTGCSVYFEHPLSGDDFGANIYKGIILYELHLRYYLQGLIWSGFPYAFHTVGSAFAVKALSYVRAGGMNRRQAGEDFYFIQKLIYDAGYFSLNSTTVFPSPRVSSRVPFGTGASMGRLSEGNLPVFLTYNILAFNELRSFFLNVENIFYCKPEDLHGYYKIFPDGVRLFLDEKEWTEKMVEIKNNTSGLASFRKRFFVWFNMFRIVKYMNHVHSGLFEKRPVDISASELLMNYGIVFESKEPMDLLLYFRTMEKNKLISTF